MRTLLLLALACISQSAIAQSENAVILSDKVTTGFTDSKILDKLPEVIVIVVSNKDFSGELIKFSDTSGKAMLTIQWNCTSDDKKCIELSQGDIKDGHIELRFLAGKLIGITDRIFPVSKYKDIAIPKGGLKVQVGRIEVPSTTKPSDNSNGDKPAAAAVKTPTFCDSLSAYPKQDTLPESVKRTLGFLCPDTENARKKKNIQCCRVIPTPLDYVYAAPCFDKNGDKVYYQYHLIVDKNNPANSALLEIKNDKEVGYPSFQKRPVLRADRSMIVSLVGDKGKTYSIDTAGNNNFVDLEPSVASAFQSISEGLTKKEEQKAAAETPQNIHVDSAKANKDTTKENKETEETKAKYATVESTITVRNELYTLRSDVDGLNIQYPYISFITEAAYRRQLNCLFSNLISKFGLPHKPTDGSDLLKMLTAYIKDQLKVDPKYFKEICKYLSGLSVAFDDALNKSKNYQAYQKLITIPNADEFKIDIKDGKDPLFSQTFRIREGFKLDFSTGIFMTGLSVSDFVPGAETFRYKMSRDTILPTGKDSLIYSGTVGEVTRTVLHRNRKYNFSTGFLVHGYRRSGGSIDWGGVGGVTLDLDGQIQFMLGGSLMFKFGKTRVSLVFGAATGKEKVLSNEYVRYYYDGKPALYDRLSDVPNDYTLTTSPATYPKTRITWLAGITFNFASMKLK